MSGEDWDNFVKERGTTGVEPRMALVVQRSCGALEIRNSKLISARRTGLVRHCQSVGFRGVAFGYPWRLDSTEVEWRMQPAGEWIGWVGRVASRANQGGRQVNNVMVTIR